MVVMAVAVLNKWKYSLGYYLTKNNMPHNHIASAIKKATEVLEGEGFIVFGITSDQGSNLQKCFKTLGCTPESPCLEINNKE